MIRIEPLACVKICFFSLFIYELECCLCLILLLYFLSPNSALGFRVRDLYRDRHKETASSLTRFSSPAFRRPLCLIWTSRSRSSLPFLRHPCPLRTRPSTLSLPHLTVSTVLWGTFRVQVLCKLYLLIFPLIFFFANCS